MERAALLAVGCSALGELFATLTFEDAKYSTATAALTAHFTAKKSSCGALQIILHQAQLPRGISRSLGNRLKDQRC